MKTEGRLSRSPLTGLFGDAVFAVLCAFGHNIRKILAHLRALLAWIIVAIQTAVMLTRGICRCSERPTNLSQRELVH
jgi:IS5 family transposase